MFQYAYLYNEAKLKRIPDIYLQDPMYFSESDEDIKYFYRQDIPNKTDMVAIHVRRAGNPHMASEPPYSQNGFYVNLCDNTRYYEEAVAMFDKNTKFLVFSDDIEFCKEYFKGSKYEFYHGTELQDFNLMASCVGHIIANSSFSWWAAYVAPYTQKVIAPSADNWYADGLERTVCPNTWIRL
jgi:hypothetical protein